MSRTTQVIRRHKAGKPTEFGRKLWLGEVEGGIISEFRLLEDGGGLDHPELPASLEAHQQRFGRPPNLLAGDRGVFSPENEELAQKLKIKQIVLPKAGHVSKERKCMRGKAGSGGASGSARGSKGGSGCSNVTLGWVAARIMAKRGWSAGSAGGS